MSRIANRFAAAGFWVLAHLGAATSAALTVSRQAIAAVIDGGPGLPEAEIEQVFQPFHRTAATRAYGGDARLRSSPDGVRAEVHLPLMDDKSRLFVA